MKQNILELYNKYAKDFEKSEKYMQISNKFVEEMEKISKELNETQLKKVEQIQEYFLEMCEEEMKEAFYQGYCLGVNLTTEAIHNQKK